MKSQTDNICFKILDNNIVNPLMSGVQPLKLFKKNSFPYYISLEMLQLYPDQGLSQCRMLFFFHESM